MYRRNVYEYPLTGILYCAKCGYRYQGTSNASNHRLKKRKRWYKCSSMGTYHIKCDNVSVKAEDIEPKVFDIIKKVIMHENIASGRIDRLVKAHVYCNDTDVRKELEGWNDLLKVNMGKQSKLNDSYMDNLIGSEIYRDKSSLLREEEKKINMEIGRCKIRLVEKERSEAYLKTLRLAVENFDEAKMKIDIVEKKEILKLIIKSVEINGREMVAVHLYEPFKKMYEEALEKCNILKNQEVTIKTEVTRKVCILEPSDAK